MHPAQIRVGRVYFRNLIEPLSTGRGWCEKSQQQIDMQPAEQYLAATLAIM
jgi:hypothetical protein